MSKLTTEELKAVANRAMLLFPDEELEVYLQELEPLVGFANKLNELDTQDVVPMTHALQLENVMREDVVADVLDREVMLESVKESKNGEIKVPTIL